jgi:hypothetical protein
MNFTNCKSLVKRIDFPRYWRAYPPLGGLLGSVMYCRLVLSEKQVDSEVFKQVDKHLYMRPTGSYTTNTISQEIER